LRCRDYAALSSPSTYWLGREEREGENARAFSRSREKVARPSGPAFGRPKDKLRGDG